MLLSRDITTLNQFLKIGTTTTSFCNSDTGISRKIHTYSNMFKDPFCSFYSRNIMHCIESAWSSKTVNDARSEILYLHSTVPIYLPAQVRLTRLGSASTTGRRLAPSLISGSRVDSARSTWCYNAGNRLPCWLVQSSLQIRETATTQNCF